MWLSFASYTVGFGETLYTLQMSKKIA